MIHNRLYHFK